MAELQSQFDAAARVQLDRDRRALDRYSVRHYARQVTAAAHRFRAVTPDLQRLQRLATRPTKMREVREEIAFVNRTLAGSDPPPPLVKVHTLMVTAVNLALAATRESFDRGVSRVTSQQVRAAFEAVTTFERATVELEAVQRNVLSR